MSVKVKLKEIAMDLFTDKWFYFLIAGLIGSAIESFSTIGLILTGYSLAKMRW